VKKSLEEHFRCRIYSGPFPAPTEMRILLDAAERPIWGAIARWYDAGVQVWTGTDSPISLTLPERRKAALLARLTRKGFLELRTIVSHEPDTRGTPLIGTPSHVRTVATYHLTPTGRTYLDSIRPTFKVTSRA
jgi:hypothetical protein